MDKFYEPVDFTNKFYETVDLTNDDVYVSTNIDTSIRIHIVAGGLACTLRDLSAADVARLAIMFKNANDCLSERE